MRLSYFLAIFITVAAFLWMASGVVFPSKDSDETPSAAASNDAAKSDEPQTESVAEKLMRVRVKTISPQDYTRKVIGNGRSTASKNVVIRAETAGQVVQVAANEGAKVKRGDQIIHIDIRERQQRVKESEELLTQRRIEFEAAERLSKQGYASDVRVAETQSAFEAARASLTQAKIDLEKTTIVAPFDGVLGKRYVDIGDYLRVADEVTDIVDLDPLEVTVYVNENEVMQLKEGDVAVLKFSNNVERQGHVSFIAPAADVESRTFQVNIEMENADNALPAGLTVQVEIAVAQEQAYQIPPSVLTLNDAGDIGVKTVDDKGMVDFIPVKILDDTAGNMWVSGLVGSPKLIVVGQDFVTVGQVIDAVEKVE